MIKLALVGMDIGYTKSPTVHKNIADVLGIEMNFEVCDTPVDAFDDTVRSLLGECDGFFVTKPYKNDIKRHLIDITTKCGVNLVRCADRTGFNTDGMGFIRALDRAFQKWRNDVSAAVVLGAGGAAYSVTEALIAAGKKVYVFNRTPKNAAKLCTALGAELYLNQPAEMIVNCTTLGIMGEDALSECCILPEFAYGYDLIYAERTPFITRLDKSGARTASGIDMLIYQAIEGDKILLNSDFDVNEVFEAVKNKIERETVR